MLIKKLSFIVLITVLLFGVIGCTTTESSTESESSTSDEAVSESSAEDTSEESESEDTEDNVVYFFNSTLSTPELEVAWAEVFAEFEEETGIHVEARYQGTWDEYPQLLTAAKLAGDPVDVGVTGVGLVQSPMGPAGLVMDLTDLAVDLVDRYEPGILESSTMGDKLWILPLADGGCTTMIYNADMFAELGLEVPKTFEEIVAVAQVIRDEKGITPMMLHGKDTWAWPMMFFDTYAQSTGNESVANVEAFLTGEKQFTGEQEVAAFTYIKQLFDEGVMATDSLDTDGEGMIAAFAQEKVAMLFLLDSYITYIQAANPDINIGIMEYPLMTEDAYSEHAFGVGDGGLFIPSFIDESHLENAMRLIEFLTRPENAEKILTANGPTKFKIFKDVDTGEDELTLQLNELIVPNTSVYLDWIWPAEVNDAFCQAIPALVSDTITAEEATELVQDAYDTLVLEEEYIYDWWNDFTPEQEEDITPSFIPDLSQ